MFTKTFLSIFFSTTIVATTAVVTLNEREDRVPTVQVETPTTVVTRRSSTSTQSTIANKPAVEPPNTVGRPQDAGLFKHPATYTPPRQQTITAAIMEGELLTGQRRARQLAVQIPYWHAIKRLIVLPTVNIEGVVYEGHSLKREADGTFVPIYSPWIAQGQPVSAANYRAGTLVLTSLMVGDIRYSNVTLQLNDRGKFQLVDAYVPISVANTSTENYKKLPFGSQILPVIKGVYALEVQQTAAFAFADFTQTGQYTYFADIIEWFSSTNPQEKSSIHFYNNVRQQWVNITQSLLNNPLPRGCESSRKAITADFNGDEIPDIFVACWGSEHPSVYNDSNSDQSFIVMSRPNGTYEVTTTSIPRGRYHAAVAIDFNNSGFADIYVSNFQDKISKLQRLRNNRNGSFTLEHVLGHPASNTNIWTMEIVKHANSNFIVLAGSDTVLDRNTGLNPSMFEITNSGSISNNAYALVPSLHADTACDSKCFSVNIDVLTHNGNLYILKTNSQYTNYAIAEYNLGTRQLRYVHQHDGSKYQQYAPGSPMPACHGFHGATWFEFMRVHNNALIADAQCINPNVKLN